MPSILKLARHAYRAPEIVSALRQTSAWRQVVSRYLGLGRPEYPFRIPLWGDGSLSTDSQEELRVFWHVFIRRCYRLPWPCQTIIDAGANVGLFSVWAARERPTAQIFSLEPFPTTFESLCKNVKANRLDQRIRPIQLGLGGESGYRLMRGDAESPRRALVLGGSEVPPTETTVAVRCVSLKDLFDELGLRDVDLLKMDIEGAEWEVLFATPPSVLSRVKNLELEYHEVNAQYGYTSEKLFAHLRTSGHRLVRHHEDAYRTGMASFSRP